MPDYDADFYGWANEQAALLRAGRLALHLKGNPSLQARLAEGFEEAYALAVPTARRKNGLDRSAFPLVDPFGPHRAMDEEFYPE